MFTFPALFHFHIITKMFLPPPSHSLFITFRTFGVQPVIMIMTNAIKFSSNSTAISYGACTKNKMC